MRTKTYHVFLGTPGKHFGRVGFSKDKEEAKKHAENINAKGAGRAFVSESRKGISAI